MTLEKAARVAGVLASLLSGWPLLHGEDRAARDAAFAAPPPVRVSSQAPLFREGFIDPEPPHVMSHVASVCELRDGRLAAAWYAGSREGAADVAIYMSTLAPGDSAWSRPRAIVTRESASRDLGRFVKKVGNAVMFADTRDTLRLVYVTVAVGGWSGSSLNLTASDDGGNSWTQSVRLTLSPFFNVAELVKNGPAALTGGGWAVPIYHELLGRMGEVLWLRDDGDEVRATKSRIAGGRSTYQPALVPLDGDRAVAVLRAAGPSRTVSLARTEDRGRTWSPPVATNLPNPDSGLDAIRLPDGRLLLAFNDSTGGRGNLRLALSADAGRTWVRRATLASEEDGDFSYPSLIQTADGLVHVVFSWQRRLIRHVAFNTAWLGAGAREEAP